MPSDPHPDLFWLAFRYVSGALDADASAAFEDQLARDQPSREAVAEAVALIEALAAAGPGTPDVLPLRRPFRPTLAWLAIAAAAACVALLVVSGTRTNHNAPTVTQIEASAPDPAVVMAWSGLRQPGGAPDLMAWLDEPAAAEADQADLSEVSGTDDGALPAWLIEAASLRDGPGPDPSTTKEN